MPKTVVWVSAIMALIAGIAGVLLPIFSMISALTLLGSVPELVGLGELMLDWSKDYLLALPFVIAQIILAVWAIGQLRQQKVIGRGA